MFVAAVFTKAKRQQRPKCPSVGGWMGNQYIHILEYCTVTEGREHGHQEARYE